MLELSGTPDRARVLGGALGEAERRVLRLFLGAALASPGRRAALSRVEVAAAGGPRFRFGSLWRLAGVGLELERPSGGYSALPLFERLDVVGETRVEVALAGLNESLREGLEDALRRGAL